LFEPDNCVNVSAVPTVDAELEGSSADDVIQCEDRIVSQWREVSANEQHELCKKVDDILSPLGLQTRLLVVERANSIVLSITVRSVTFIIKFV